MTRQQCIFYDWSYSDGVWLCVKHKKVKNLNSLGCSVTKHTPSGQRSHSMSSKTGTTVQIPGWLSAVYLLLTADGKGCQQSAASLSQMLAGVLAAVERVHGSSHHHLFRVEPTWLIPDVTFDPSTWVIPQLTGSTTRSVQHLTLPFF